jgi:YesN/AraC family two-component response regulator
MYSLCPAPAGEFRVVIADDHAIVRAGLATLLEHAGGFKVVAHANTGVEAVEQWKKHWPDLVLMDLKMPEMSGLEAIARIRSEKADAAVVILTTFDGDEDVFKGIRAGARGYLLKDASSDELLRCVKTVCEGRNYIPVSVAAKLANRISSNAYRGGLPRHRLKRVLDYIAANMAADISLKQLAAVAGMSAHYFAELFRQSTGCAPHRYVLSQRIQRAKERLRDPGISVIDAGLDAGFQNPSHFARTFRKLVGTSPSRYKSDVLASRWAGR